MTITSLKARIVMALIVMAPGTAITPAQAPSSSAPSLDVRVRAEISPFKGKVFVFARNLESGQTYSFNGDERVRTASTIKVAVMIEAFTRVSEGTIQYEVTIDDPNVYTKPWKLVIPVTRDPQYVLYEYACQEGNQAVENILRGGRAKDAQ